MLTTIEAEIDVNGNVRLLEPLKLKKKSRAIVTVLDERIEPQKQPNLITELLKTPEFANRKSYSVETIETQIEELRNSWE